MTQTKILPPPDVQSELLYLWKRYYRVSDTKESIKQIRELIISCQSEIRIGTHNSNSLQRRLNKVTKWLYNQEQLSNSYRITNLLPKDEVQKHIKKILRQLASRKCNRCLGEGIIYVGKVICEYEVCEVCEGSGYME